MFTGKKPPWRPLSMTADAETPQPPFPLTHVGHLRTERQFGVNYPNEGFETTTKRDSMPSPEGGLSAKDEIVLRLSSLQTENADQKARQSILLGELADVLEQIEALTLEVTNDRTTRLTAEHKEIRRLGRIAEKELNLANDAYTAADVYALNMIEVQSQARQILEGLHGLEERGEHLKRFHTDKELEEWKQKYREQQDLVLAANQMAQDAVNDRNQRQKDLEEAREKVNRLAGEESRIRAELKGTPLWDAETGLGEPGRGGVMTPAVAALMARRDDE